MKGEFNPETIHKPPQEESVEQKREALPDIGEVVKQGHEAAEGANAQIAADLEQAKILQEQFSEQARPIVEQIQGLQKEVEEEKAAFDARAERLNSPYVLSPELAKVLKVSRVLKRPLLLEGEPGTGKTSLAYALAGHEDLPIIHAQCKSTTSAQELLYTFDVVQRLQDAQLGKDVSDPRKYVKLGPLGRAFSAQEQVILLIDEVDKAKRDFSNDLLHELDQMSFFVTETGEEVAAKNRPIVIVTSNHERDLPEPVLRRVVYSYIEFPSPEQMTEIVKAHVPDVSGKLLETAIKRFYEIRQTNGLEKKPSTSEMLDWIKVLQEFGTDEVGRDIPFPETLLKYKTDSDRLLGKPQEVETEKQEAVEDEKAVEYFRTIDRLIKDVLSGKSVVRLKAENEGGDPFPDPRILQMLANENYYFIAPEKDSYHRRANFQIREEGVKKIKDLIFSLENNDRNNQLLQKMVEAGLISSEFSIADTTTDINDIEAGNESVTVGRDKQGFQVMKTKDGSVIIEKIANPRVHYREELAKQGLPKEYIASLFGEKVVRLKKKDRYSNTPYDDKRLYALLEQGGYKFSTDGYSFKLEAEGVQNQDGLTVFFSGQDHPLYKLLLENGFIASEFVVSDELVELSEVEKKNYLYTQGKDKSGAIIYKTEAGKVLFERGLAEQTE